MTWSFALVNNRLSEIFFERKSKRIEILGYAYVKASKEIDLSKERKFSEFDSVNI